MISEKLVGVKRLAGDDGWSRWFVFAGRLGYEYVGQSFVLSSDSGEADDVVLPAGFQGATIVEVRGDGESAVLLLDSQDVLVFDVARNPIVSKSSLALRFVSRAAFFEWKAEFFLMDEWSVRPNGDVGPP